MRECKRESKEQMKTRHFKREREREQKRKRKKVLGNERE